MNDASGDASAVLAVDAGQSGIRLRHASRDGARPGVLTDRPLLPQLSEAIGSFLAETGAHPTTVAVGLSGLTPADATEELLRLVSAFGVAEVFLTHDSITSYLGALGLHQGVVVAAGTGVVTLAAGPAGVARVDGWGHVMGDEGSAFWLGQRALTAAMRAYDGRGSSTLLLDRLRERWPDPETAYIALQASPDKIALVASFARVVDGCAEQDDAVARDILESASIALAESAATALDRVAAHAPGTKVAAIGGVFRSRVIGRRFIEILRERFPAVVEARSGGTGLDGAQSLAVVPGGHPLSTHIGRARRSEV